MKLFLLSTLLCIAGFQAQAASKPYQTESLNKNILSLLVHPQQNWEGLPLISLQGQETLSVSFDLLSFQYNRLNYNIIHCNADWTPSDLSPIEYLNGFPDQPIENYDLSFNTTVAYTHYQLLLPNENTQFKVSGNYVVEVSYADAPDQALLRACFSVLDSKQANISAQVSSNTDIDFNKHHQQVQFTLNTPLHDVRVPQQELQVYLSQNNRRDNTVARIQATGSHNKQFTYTHNRQLIFEAGNEFRRFETTTTAYQGMGVANVSFYEPYYHITLATDAVRANRSYLYDEDQNGRFFAHCVDCHNYTTDADYFYVHFTLDAPNGYMGTVYLLSEAFNYLLDERSQMQYQPIDKVYTKTALLKQGSYNYQYLQKESGSSKGSTAYIEGNYYQTENEYTLWVYYRGLGERYDQLIGVHRFSSKN